MRICGRRSPRLGLAVLLGLLGFAPSGRAAVSVDVGSVTGSPGTTVMFFVTLTTTAGEQVAATDTTIGFEPETPVVQCTTNPAFVISQCEKFPTGCTAGVDCQETRCIIAPFGGTISSGSQLYFCNVKVAADAAPGEYPLHCSAVDVRDAAGNSLNPQCTDGQVQVVLPTPTPTVTPTPTPTATPTPITATVAKADKGSTTLTLTSPASSGFPNPGRIIQIDTNSVSIGYTLGPDNTTLTLSSPLPVDVTADAQITVVSSAPASGGGGGGCEIASMRQSHTGWLLLLPATVLPWLRRRR